MICKMPETTSLSTRVPARRTIHALSKQSISQNRDAFLFYVEQCNFELHVARITTSSLTFKDPDDEYFGKEIGYRYSLLSFAEWEEREKEDAKLYPKASKHNSFTEDMKAKANARDGGVCFIQAISTNNTKLTWLVPPTLASSAHIATEGHRPCPIDLTEEYKDFHTIITLEESVLSPFLENKFGIDVEVCQLLMSFNVIDHEQIDDKDNYKIVIFQDFPGSEKMAANSRLPQASIDGLNDNSRFYLMGNFKYCLSVNLMGGDIIEDYPDLGSDLIEEVAERGFQSPTDEKWKTTLGQEILDYHRDDLPDAFLELLD
ncbi:hypothetical protein M413DRAFT_13687 [Hebeloma cylindrosporum]|uniref:Uncharacterized protein n=1 Tax=Hebeloma cylindrosporum TaxID=76867 RepID=A0A0C2XG91_HEBCY|nr:hypothetical protein M413DRAFT_13687 [Hebeloma cylindrosporum h7]